jgi:hypothetical protein
MADIGTVRTLWSFALTPPSFKGISTAYMGQSLLANGWIRADLRLLTHRTWDMSARDSPARIQRLAEHHAEPRAYSSTRARSWSRHADSAG